MCQHSQVILEDCLIEPPVPDPGEAPILELPAGAADAALASPALLRTGDIHSGLFTVRPTHHYLSFVEWLLNKGCPGICLCLHICGTPQPLPSQWRPVPVGPISCIVVVLNIDWSACVLAHAYICTSEALCSADIQKGPASGSGRETGKWSAARQPAAAVAASPVSAA